MTTLRGIFLAVATLVGGLMFIPAAQAATAATVDGVAIPANLADPIAVEQFLLNLQAVQGSTSLALLAGHPALQAAVTTAETRGTSTTQTVTGTATAGQQAQILAETGATPDATAGTVCGWAYKKISYKPGLITYYSLALQTDFCWNGTNLVGTPYQTHSGSASWGWSYGTRFTTFTWFPYPREFYSGVEADMHLGAYHNYPYINTYLYGTGGVYTWWNTTN